MPYEAIIGLVENYVKQLEGLAFQKDKASLALQLQGAIDCGIRISGVGSDNWNTRVRNAMQRVVQDAPVPEELKNLAPEDYMKAIAGAIPAPRA